jgi:hypothetical protein
MKSFCHYRNYNYTDGINEFMLCFHSDVKTLINIVRLKNNRDLRRDMLNQMLMDNEMFKFDLSWL